MGTVDMNQKKEKAIALFDRLLEKEKFHHKKWHRARKTENRDFHYNRYKLLFDAASRMRNLAFRIDRNKKFGSGRDWWEPTAEKWCERKREQKLERKKKFDSNYRISIHFMQTSLSADYGTFYCDRCKSKFYHSPSDVYYGAELLYTNCCGNCVNKLLSRNNQDEIFY